METDVPQMASASDSLAANEFAALLDGHPTSASNPASGYSTHPDRAIAYRISESLPGNDIDEMWRQGYLDVTTVGEAAFGQAEMVNDLAAWLNHHQPISLAGACTINRPLITMHD